MLEPHGFTVYSENDVGVPQGTFNVNNSSGFDLVIITPCDKKIRIQSKLRQVKGITDCSTQINFETTRRNSKKNENKNHTGHVCYSLDEFDFVMVSLVNDRTTRERIKDCNLWTFCLIPVLELEDKKRKCCVSSIPAKVLSKNILKITDDITKKILLNSQETAPVP